MNDIAVGAALQAEYSGLQFTSEPIDPMSLSMLTASSWHAVTNLLSNAFKLPAGKTDLFKPFGERRGKNRAGLGLGRSIARRAVRAQGGEIEVRDMAGKGCTFVIQVPAATDVIRVAEGDSVS